MIIGVHALHDAHMLQVEHKTLTRATQYRARHAGPRPSLDTAHKPNHPASQHKSVVATGVLATASGCVLFASGEGEMIHDTPL